MSVKDDLFQLIQSMSKSEKRYFKLDTRKGGDKTNNYLRLFDALNSMEGYDEDKIRQKFKGEKFIKHLPQEKKYLFEAILRSMRNYQSDKSSTAQIKEGLLDAQYLYRRGLYEPARKTLKRIKKIAYQFENYLAILEINKEERRLVSDSKIKTIQDDIELLINEKNQVTQLLYEEFTYQDLYDRLFAHVNKQYEIKDAESQELLKDFFPPNLLKEVKLVSSQMAKRRLLQSLAIYYQLLGEYDKYYEFHNKVVDWWEENREFREENTYRYRIDLSNFLQASFYLGKYEYVPKLLEKLEEEKPQNIREKSVLFQKVSINRLAYYLNTGALQEAEKLIPEISEGLKIYNVNETSKKVLITNIGILYFIIENYEECSNWLKKIINEKKTSNRKDTQYLARILHLISLYEEGTVDLIDPQMRSAIRFFTLNLKTESFELKVLKHLKSVFHAPSLDQKKEIQLLKDYLIKKKGDFNKNIYPGLDEIMLWVDSKLERISMVEILKKKVQA